MLPPWTRDFGWLLLRATFGLGLSLLHGYPKVFEGKVSGLAASTAAMGLPAPTFFAWVASLTELVGGLLVALGLATRPGGWACASVMLVALYSHVHKGDPFGRMELALLYFVAMVAFALIGGGRYSLDARIRLRSPFARRGAPDSVIARNA